MKKFTFTKNQTDGAAAHDSAFGYTTPKGLPWQLEYPSAFPPEEMADFRCVEYGELLAKCLERGKPVTVREYVDLFWLDGETYRWDTIEATDYKEFVAKVSAVQFDA